MRRVGGGKQNNCPLSVYGLIINKPFHYVIISILRKFREDRPLKSMLYIQSRQRNLTHFMRTL
jgi:hypothetical protein